MTELNDFEVSVFRRRLNCGRLIFDNIVAMSSRRQSRVIQGEKTNIRDVDLGSLLSIRSRLNPPVEALLPLVPQRSAVSTPAPDSRVKVSQKRLKTGASHLSEKRTVESLSRSELHTINTIPSFDDLSSDGIERKRLVEKLRKEFIERNTLHFTKLREAFRTIDKDKNG